MRWLGGVAGGEPGGVFSPFYETRLKTSLGFHPVIMRISSSRPSFSVVIAVRKSKQFLHTHTHTTHAFTSDPHSVLSFPFDFCLFLFRPFFFESNLL